MTDTHTKADMEATQTIVDNSAGYIRVRMVLEISQTIARARREGFNAALRECILEGDSWEVNPQVIENIRQRGNPND